MQHYQRLVEIFGGSLPAAVGGIVASLLLLTIGADWLVRGSAMIARRMGVSSFFIGLTIVGFGTSTPELFTSMRAAWSGNGGICVGNVIGSNIFNIAFILGLTALIRPIPIKAHLVKSEALVVIAVSFVPFAALLSAGVIDRWMGVALVLALAAYIWRGYTLGLREGAVEAEAEKALEEELGVSGASAGGWRGSVPVCLGWIALGLLLLIAGSVVLVDASVAVARRLGVSDLVIGLTIISAGTSAPELFTSLVAALRRQSDISVGNILGSNIFNVLGVLGLTCAVFPQAVGRQVFVLDTPVMIVTALALLPLMLRGSSISRFEGGLLFAGGFAYVFVQYAFVPAWFG